MDGDGFDGRDAQCSLDDSEAIQLELVNLRQSVRVLPVVLHYIDIVGNGEEAGEGGGLGIP